MKTFGAFYAARLGCGQLCVSHRAFGALYFDFTKDGAFTAIVFVLAVPTAAILARGKLLKLGIIFAAFGAGTPLHRKTRIRISQASCGKGYRGANSKSPNERHRFKLHISPAI